MRARAIAIVVISLVLASCVDSERLRNNLGGADANPAADRAPSFGLAGEEPPGMAKRDASR